MPGGLLNLQNTGSLNLLVNESPSVSFWKKAYKQHPNFGLQKFRVDSEGTPSLSLTSESTFKFKIPRYADLLMDSYLAITLPTIWSPIMPPKTDTNGDPIQTSSWAPYEFKWIENIGAKMIEKITFQCGIYTLQEYSGDYLLAAVQRDFSTEKKALFDKMTGHVPEIMDPANSGGKVNMYPNAFYTTSQLGPEPSIYQRELFVPLNGWFGLKTEQAFPLISCQSNELYIHITFKPISKLFQIRDVMDETNQFPYVAPDFNAWYMQLYRFVHPPPNIALGNGDYPDTRALWNPNIHLNCTYCFLDDVERELFAKKERRYLIKQVYESRYLDVVGSTKLTLSNTGGLVSNWLFYLQRNDVNLRNEWSNYTNWAYCHLPHDVVYPDEENDVFKGLPLSIQPNGLPSGLMITGVYSPENKKDILLSLGILYNGDYRENTQPVGVYNLIEKYVRSSGNAPDGLYCYNFGVYSGNDELNPTGAANMTVVNDVEFEVKTIIPPVNRSMQSNLICDPDTGETIGVSKSQFSIYEYTYTMTVFEERYNLITFVGGNCGITYAL